MAKGFLNGPNAGILIPLAALTIPIIAILADKPWLPWLLIGLVMVAAVTVGVRSVIGYSHRLRLEEIAARERSLQLEHEQLRSAERILELDDTRGLRTQMEPPQEA